MGNRHAPYTASIAAIMEFSTIEDFQDGLNAPPAEFTVDGWSCDSTDDFVSFIVVYKKAFMPNLQSERVPSRMNHVQCVTFSVLTLSYAASACS